MWHTCPQKETVWEHFHVPRDVVLPRCPRISLWIWSVSLGSISMGLQLYLSRFPDVCGTGNGQVGTIIHLLNSLFFYLSPKSTEYFVIGALRWLRRLFLLPHCWTDRSASMSSDSPRDKATRHSSAVCTTITWHGQGHHQEVALDGTQQHIFIAPVIHSRKYKREPTSSCASPFVFIWVISSEFTLTSYCLPARTAAGPLQRHFFLKKLPSLIVFLVWLTSYSHGKINLGLSPQREVNSRWLVHINTNDKIIKTFVRKPRRAS